MRWPISIIFLISLSLGAKIPKSIYGKDNRLDLYQVTNTDFRNWTRSTAALMSWDKLNPQGENYAIIADTLAEKGVCPSERFSSQITASGCSGFLVAEDLIVTAGHCVSNQYDCTSKVWVFDYALNENSAGDSFSIPKDNVYHCQELIEHWSGWTIDYALLRLKRPVLDRAPLPFRRSGKIANNAPLVIIGYPSGLPVKIADGARVKKNSHENFFEADLDSFGGNSGSAVLNVKTGEVEGVLVRGKEDYVKSSENGIACERPKKYGPIVLFGPREEVTRITIIESLH